MMNSVTRRRSFAPYTAAVILSLIVAATAGAQGLLVSRLPAIDARPVLDSEIVNFIDEFFEDGKRGDHIVRSNILIVETQPYESSFDIFDNLRVAVGLIPDWVSFTNTTYLAATAPALPSYIRGYHDDAAAALVPGATAAQVHSIASAGKDPRERPRIQGDPSRRVGGGSSTHVLVWAAEANEVIDKDVLNIIINFRALPNTTVDLLYGDGSSSLGVSADSIGPTTFTALKGKLQEIGAMMDDGEDEQFILFVTGLGASSVIFPTDFSFSQGSKLADILLPETVVDDMKRDPNNGPSVTFAMDVDLSVFGESAVGFDVAGTDFLGYNGDATQNTFDIPGGDTLHNYSFPLREDDIFDFAPIAAGQGVSKSMTSATSDLPLTFGVSNFSGQPITLLAVIFDPGDMAMVEGAPDRKVLTAVARAPGSGSTFETRWDIANVGPKPVDLDLVFTPRQDQGGQPVSASTTVQPGALLEIEDPLAEYFGMVSGSTVGAVEIIPAPGAWGSLRMNSTVSARLSNGKRYGQFFPVVDASETIAAGESALFSTTHDASRFRVNVGVMALEDGTRVMVEPVDPQDTPLASAKVLDLDSSETTQINNLASAFGLGNRSDYLVKLRVEAGSATGYVSVLDGLGGAGTSDPTTILRERSSASRVTLLELGSIQGQNEFAGSATLTNFGSGAAQVRADFFQRGKPGVAATNTLNLPAGKATGYGDLVGDVFGIHGQVGSVVLTVTSGGPIAATAREFAVFRNGSGAVTGTAGQRIPGLLDGDMLTSGRIWHFVGLRERQTSKGNERTNVAAFNPGPEDLELTMKLFGPASGATPDGSLTQTVRAGELIQVNNVISKIDPGQDGGVRRIELETTGPVFAQAFRVNPSGDPITIDGR